MWKKTLAAFFTLSFAFGVLMLSAFRTASVKYEFNPANPEEDTTVLGKSTSKVDYYLPYPGKVLPDNPLWPLKAGRDKLWLMVNTSATKEAELKLLFADKRLGSSVLLFEKGLAEEGLSVLTKAEKYLEEAHDGEVTNRTLGFDTSDFLVKLASASLKHYEVIEYLLTLSGDEAKPVIFEVQEIPRKVYEDSRNALLERGISPPENPFSW